MTVKEALERAKEISKETQVGTIGDRIDHEVIVQIAGLILMNE